MNRKILASLCVACTLVLSLCADTIEIPLHYAINTNKNWSGPFFPGGYQHLDAELVQPAHIKQAPTWVARQPIFFTIELGEGVIAGALDRTPEHPDLFTRLYLDLNQNGDWTDDAVLDAPLPKDRRASYGLDFPVLDCAYTNKGTCYGYRFAFNFYCRDRHIKDGDYEPNELRRKFSFGLMGKCAYTGAFELAGNTYSVMLGDTGADGVFDSTFQFWGDQRDYASGDAFHISTGSWAGCQSGFILGNRLLVHGTLFRVRVQMPERKLVLESIPAEELHPLQISAETVLLQLYNRKESRAVMLFEPGKLVRLEADEYRLFSYCMHRASQGNARWKLEARAQANDSAPWADTRTAADASLMLGEPFKVTMRLDEYSIRQWQAGDKEEIRLRQEMTGAGAEQVRDVSCFAGQESTIEMAERYSYRPKEPAYRILKPDGEMVAKGNFEYG